jgi:hypothetical protein
MADCRAGTLFLTLEEFSCRGDGMETMFFADCRIGPPSYEPVGRVFESLRAHHFF